MIQVVLPSTIITQDVKPKLEKEKQYTFFSETTSIGKVNKEKEHVVVKAVSISNYYF